MVKTHQTLAELAKIALFGTLSETYRTCGHEGCHCHKGQKHGPHLYMSFRGEDGKTTGYYVPQGVTEEVRAGVKAWHEIQELLRSLAEANRKRLLGSKSKRGKVERD